MEAGPLFICHANCARSVLGEYLYRGLTGHYAMSAGLEPGSAINVRVNKMLSSWKIDSSEHRPKRVTREICENAHSIYVMGPKYLRRLLDEIGYDLTDKTYLYADPFAVPNSFSAGEFLVTDPSFIDKSTKRLVNDYRWMHERTYQIRLAMLNDGATLIPVSRYKHLIANM